MPLNDRERGRYHGTMFSGPQRRPKGAPRSQQIRLRTLSVQRYIYTFNTELSVSDSSLSHLTVRIVQWSNPRRCLLGLRVTSPKCEPSRPASGEFFHKGEQQPLDSLLTLVHHSSVLTLYPHWFHPSLQEIGRESPKCLLNNSPHIRAIRGVSFSNDNVE